MRIENAFLAIRNTHHYSVPDTTSAYFISPAFLKNETNLPPQRTYWKSNLEIMK